MTFTLFLLISTVSSAYCYGLWREGYEPNTENGFSFIEEAVAPIAVRWERFPMNHKVRVSATYRSGVETVAYWILYFSAGSDITTTGDTEKTGQGISTTLEVSDSMNMTDMALVVTSNIGEIRIELTYNATETLNKTIEIPQTGVRVLVPYVIKPLPYEEACTNQLVFVKYERTDESVSLYPFQYNPWMYWVDSDGDKDYIELKKFFTVYTEKRKDYIGRRIDLLEEHIESGGVLVANLETGMSDYPVEIESLLTYRYGTIVPPSGKGRLVWFSFDEDFEDFDDDEHIFYPESPYKSIVCKAFGFPRPEISITDPNGNPLSVINLTLKPGLLTHVMANIDSENEVDVYGEYTCTATNGQNKISKKIIVTDGSANK